MIRFIHALLGSMVVRAREDAKPDMSARLLTVTLQIGRAVPHPRCPGPNGAPGP
jgi:hypothetical protein